jgi:hypothetical protein
MQVTQPELWSAKEEQTVTVTQEVQDERVILGKRWMLIGSNGVVVPTKAKAIDMFVAKYGRTPAIIHYQETAKLWFVGPKEGSEK